MAIAYSKRFIVFGNGYKGGSEKVGEADTEAKAREIMKKAEKTGKYYGTYKVDMIENMGEELKSIEKICNSVEDGILGTYGIVITKDQAMKQLEKAANIYRSMKESFNKQRAKVQISNAEWLIQNY